MVDVGTFGIPGNFATPYYNASTRKYDMPGLRKYLRGQLPPDRYSFTDPQIDDLISGKGLPGSIDMYDLQAGQGGSFGTGNRAGKVIVTDKELDETEPEVATSEAVVTPEPPPGPVSEIDTSLPGVLATNQGDLSAARYDPDVGGVGGTFFGSYGTRIDPMTGEVTQPLPHFEGRTAEMGGSFTAPLYDPSAAFTQRTGPEGAALGSYNDLFPVYLYGGAPSSALVELDRYGLGLDFVRANPALLQQWWTDVFKPTYGRIAAGGEGYDVNAQKNAEWANRLGKAVEYVANPLTLLFGAGGAGPVGQAAIDAATKSFGGIDPASMQLGLPLMPDTLLGQIFGGDTGGLTIAPGTSDAIINALGDLVVPSTQFGVDPTADKAVLDKLGQLIVGGDQFDLEPGIGQSLIDRLGTMFVGPEQFELGTGFNASGPYSAEDKLLNDIGIINVGPDQFDINDPNAVVAALRDLIPSIQIGPEAFNPANVGATVQRLKDLIPDVQIDPSQFSPTDINSTLNKLREDIGSIQVGPEQFVLGTDYTPSTGERTVEEKLLADIGVVQVAPGQFELTDTDKVIGKLLTDIGLVQVGPNQFKLGTDAQGTTPEQQLLSDLGIIEVGPDGFVPTDTADVKLKLLNDIGMIQVGVGSEGGAPGFSLDPAAAGILRDELVNAINPIGAADIQGLEGYDPTNIANVLRSDITSRIDAINRGDIGMTDSDIDLLLNPFEQRVAALPDQFQQAAADPISDLISGLRGQLDYIKDFKVEDDFLEKGTKKAGSLLDLLYGTGGAGREGAGIANFAVPAALDTIESRLGSFGPEGTGIMGNVSALQDALQNIDLDALQAPEGLDALVANVGQLGADLPGAASGLGAFQDALGTFSPEDQAVMGMLLNMIGPEGIASLSTQELSGLIERFRGMQGTALTDALSGYWSEPAGYEPWLDALKKGVLSTYGPIPEMEWEGLLSEIGSGLLPSITEAIGKNFYEHEPAFKNVISRIGEFEDLFKEYAASRGDGTGEGGDGVPGGSDTTGNWLKTLQDALKPKVTDQKDLTAEYLTAEPVTASLLADLGDTQTKQDEELLEQLQRYGVVQSGDTVEAIPELDSLQRRERMGVLSDAAQRIQTDRDAAMQQGLDLGKTITTRDLGLGELSGLIDNQQTLGGRQADLDIISAVIAALDPDLDIQGDKDELAVLLLQLLQNVPGGKDAEWIANFKNMVMGD